MIGSIYGKVTALAPKVTGAIRHLPAGRAIHLAVVVVGTVVVAKEVVRFAKETLTKD